MSTNPWKSLLLASLLATPAFAVPPPEVSAKMRGAFQSLMALQPSLVTAQGFSDPARAAEIARSLEVIAALPHAFPATLSAQEPGVAAIGGLFAEYMAEARRNFSTGNKEAARGQMTRVTSLCFGCHTRLQSEKDFVDLGRQVDALPLLPLEKAEYLAATRQFDRALDVYRALLATTPLGERALFDYSHALRHALGIQVAVKGLPAGALSLLEPLAARKDLPDQASKRVRAWLKDARSWQTDRFDPTKATANQLLVRAEALVRQSDASRSIFTDDNDDVLLLRASNYLHQALAKGLALPKRGEALLLLGTCAATLQDPLLWELDGLYLEACVREQPHTELARRCFDRFADRLYFNFTGSSGTHIPRQDLARLSTLRALAN